LNVSKGFHGLEGLSGEAFARGPLRRIAGRVRRARASNLLPITGPNPLPLPTPLVIAEV